MAKAVEIELLGEKSLHHAANPDLLTYCPSMDLVALATTDQQVLVYRLNGQRVYGAAQKASSLEVQSVKWKPNGQLLAIAWSDGSIRLVSAESTKIVHQFTTGDGNHGVTFLGWASNLTRKLSCSTKAQGTPGSWDELLAVNESNLWDKQTLNLPRDLSQIDIETSLPKLSTLASGSSPEDVFSSRASLDALFHPFDPKDNNAVDVMIIGSKAGNIHISIYDSFVLGSFGPFEIFDDSPAHLALHASNEQYSTHALLMKSSNEDNRFALVPMDLRFVSASSDYLSLLASRSTALNNLLRYIHEVQTLMISEWKSTQELPRKFLRNINETLAEKDESRDVVQALYHSVATGHTFPAVKEWLVDELSERGHKRWDKAVVSGLENLKRLIHESMLPALDRCAVILSRFSGIAKFQGPNDSIGFSSQQINLIRDTMACLHLVSSEILLQTVDELDLFASFSGWLRYEIDRLASEASNAPTDEATEKESSIDHNKVMLYLRTIMTKSPIALHLGESSPEDFEQAWLQAEQGLPLFDFLDKQFRKQRKGLQCDTPLFRVEILCQILTRQANTIFSQIAEAEKRNVLFGKAIEIGWAEKYSPIDMKMNRLSRTSCQTHVAFVPENSPSMIRIVQATSSIENGLSSTRSVESSLVQLGDGRIREIKILGDSVLVLWECERTVTLLSIRYRSEALGSSESDGYRLEYTPHAQNILHSRPTVYSNEEVRGRFSKPGFTDDGFVAERLQIRERDSKAGREDTGRVVALSKGGLVYRVLRVSGKAPDNEDDVAMS